jgi:hypothetical protein
MILFSSVKLFGQSTNYKVGILLPFQSDGNDASNKNAEAMLDYLSGVRLSLNELDAFGFQAQVFIWDLSNRDSQNIVKLVKSPQFQELDVLIGPISQNIVSIITPHIKNTKFSWVSPLKNLKLPPTNHHINFFGPDSVRVKGVLEGLKSRFPRYRYVIVGDPKNPEFVTYQKIAKRILPAKRISFHQLKNGSLAPKLPNSDSILVINTHLSQSTKSSQIKWLEKKPNSQIVGSLDWYGDFSVISGVDESKIIYPTINFTPISDSTVIEFAQTYRNTFLSEPSRFSYQGYDQMSFIGLNLLTFNTNFLNSLPNSEYIGLINSIKPYKTNSSNWYNEGIRFVKFEGFKRTLLR